MRLPSRAADSYKYFNILDQVQVDKYYISALWFITFHKSIWNWRKVAGHVKITTKIPTELCKSTTRGHKILGDDLFRSWTSQLAKKLKKIFFLNFSSFWIFLLFFENVLFCTPTTIVQKYSGWTKRIENGKRRPRNIAYSAFNFAHHRCNTTVKQFKRPGMLANHVSSNRKQHTICRKCSRAIWIFADVWHAYCRFSK